MDLSKFNTEELYDKFITAKPYNHLVIDNFFEPEYLKNLMNEIKGYEGVMNPNFNPNDPGEVYVQNNKIGIQDVNNMGPMGKAFFENSNSPEMITFLEKITGISGLIADPELIGGGVHRTSNGGRLGIHADFNIHPITKKHRRINLLLYMNEDWKPEYNGQLELWEKNMSKCAQSIPPIFNRVVIFRITDDAFHGHPIKWNGSAENPRLSIALYYYTDDRPEEEKSNPHMALWQRI